MTTLHVGTAYTTRSRFLIIHFTPLAATKSTTNAQTHFPSKDPPERTRHRNDDQYLAGTILIRKRPSAPLIDHASSPNVDANVGPEARAHSVDHEVEVASSSFDSDIDPTFGTFNVDTCRYGCQQQLSLTSRWRVGLGSAVIRLREVPGGRRFG